MKYVVLRRQSSALWEQIGAADVQEEYADGAMPEFHAVEQIATQGGVHIAIPMSDWLLFEVEAKLEVRPVIRQAEVEAEQVDGDDPGPIRMENETDEDFQARGGVIVRGNVEEMDGMTRPRQRR